MQQPDLFDRPQDLTRAAITTVAQAHLAKDDRGGLTAQRAHELLTYCAETGELTWLAPRCRWLRAGDVAGGVARQGYVRVWLDGHSYMAHRVVWLMSFGQWPTGYIDHIDGNRRNNRLQNLRNVSQAVNMQNLKAATASSTSGLLGVESDSRPLKKKFRARIRLIGGERVHLGYFAAAAEAHQAYLSAKRRLHEGCVI